MFAQLFKTCPFIHDHLQRRLQIFGRLQGRFGFIHLSRPQPHQRLRQGKGCLAEKNLGGGQNLF